MSEQQQALIFTRFTRLHPAYSGQYSGFGLGLALIKQFVNELEGEIYVESTEGFGSIFTCLIPLRIPEFTTLNWPHIIILFWPHHGQVYVLSFLVNFKNDTKINLIKSIFIF